MVDSEYSDKIKIVKNEVSISFYYQESLIMEACTYSLSSIEVSKIDLRAFGLDIKDQDDGLNVFGNLFKNCSVVGPSNLVSLG